MKGTLLKLTVLCIASLALAGGVITGSAQERGDEVQVTGLFNVHTTNPDRSTTFSLYETETGNRYDLHGVAESLAEQGGYFGLIGRNVRVTGVVSPDGSEIDVSSVDLAEFAPAGHIDLIDARHWIGTQHYVNILCRFGDSTDVTPQPPEYFEDDLLPELNAFWDEISHGQADMQFTTEGWFDLEVDRDDYFGDDNVLRFEQLRDDCLAVGEDNGVDFRNYDGINLMFNENLDGNSYGDVVSLDLNGEVNTYGLTWMAHEHWQLDPNQLRPLHVTLHELGHSFGLPHSCEVPTTRYESRWDFMSSGVVTDTIALHKDKFGWIADDDKYVPTDEDNQVIFLERLGSPEFPINDDEYLTVEIPIPGTDTRYYTAETRMRAGEYEDRIPADRGVLLHEVDLLREHPVNNEGHDCQASLVDVHGLGPGFHDGQAAMRPGVNSIYDFTDESELDLSIAPLYETDTGTWVVFNPDLDLTLNAPEEAVAGEEIEITLSLTAGGDPATFAEGWEVPINFPIFDTATLDENGEATFTVTQNSATSLRVFVEFAYLTDEVTTEILPGPPASLDLAADPETQAVGESVGLVVTNVEDEFGNTVAEGTPITFEIGGSTDEAPIRTDDGADFTADTDANGAASLSYTRLFPSDDVITASAGDDPLVTSEPVDVAWSLHETDADVKVRAQTQQPQGVRLNLAVNSVNDKLTGSVVFADDSRRFTSTDLLSATASGDYAVIYARARITGLGERIVRVDLHNSDQSGPTGQVRWIGHDTGEISLGRISIR